MTLPNELLMNDRRNSRVNYHAFFADALGRLHGERRYRVFADLERMPSGIRRTGRRTS
jgi:5-aminolevulinate synthase